MFEELWSTFATVVFPVTSVFFAIWDPAPLFVALDLSIVAMTCTWWDAKSGAPVASERADITSVPPLFSRAILLVWEDPPFKPVPEVLENSITLPSWVPVTAVII